MLASIRQRFQNSSGQFIKRSAFLAAGFAIARALGLMYSLLLGRVLSTEDYGYVQYSILLGGIIAIGTQPLLQHTLARFVSMNRGNPERLSQVVSTTLALAAVIGVGSIAVSYAALEMSGDHNVGAQLVFLGLSIYYAYYGIARGFEDSTRLSLVFIGSNFVQFIALLIVFFVLNSHDSLPALAIYGLSYVGPVILLSLLMRFPVSVGREHVNADTAREVARATAPVWVSYGLFAVGSATDVVLLKTLAGQSAAGTYTFNRTLCLGFEFLPSAVATMILPNVAARSQGARRMTLISIGAVLAASTLMAIVFLPLYPWLMSMFFSPEYQVPVTTMAIMIAAQTIWGIHGILGNVSIGKGQASVELVSRVCLLILLAATCTLLIPQYGTLGAAVANLITAVIVVGTYPLLSRLIGGRTGAKPQPSAS